MKEILNIREIDLSAIKDKSKKEKLVQSIYNYQLLKLSPSTKANGYISNQDETYEALIKDLKYYLKINNETDISY